MLDKFMIGFLSMFLIAVLTVLFIYVPISLLTEARCLEAGYPSSAVTYNFKQYCMNLQGDVTVSVDELE